MIVIIIRISPIMRKVGLTAIFILMWCLLQQPWHCGVQFLKTQCVLNGKSCNNWYCRYHLPVLMIIANNNGISFGAEAETWSEVEAKYRGIE